MSQSASSAPQVAQNMLNALGELPLWVKQVLYVELGKDLTAHFNQESLNSLSPSDTLAFYRPQLTPKALQMVMRKDDDLALMLQGGKQRLTMLDLCLQHQWSLEHACEVLHEGMRDSLLSPPASIKALGTIEYLANRIRLGQYLVKMGRISEDQLEQALRTQQYIKEALQEHSGLANILINLGYISKQDTEGILFLKEESQKPLTKLALFSQLTPT